MSEPQEQHSHQREARSNELAATLPPTQILDILDHLSDALYAVDKHWRIIYINQKAKELWGQCNDGLLGKNIWEVFPQSVGTQAYQTYLDVMRERRPITFEYLSPVVNRWYNVSASPSETGMVVHFSDITTRKQVEAERSQQQEILQTIFDQIPVMIRFLSPDGRVQLVNRAWERTLGWSLGEVQQKNLALFEQLYPDQQERHRALAFVAAATGEWADFRIRTRHGQMIDTTFANIRLADGTNLSIGQDITARKTAEERNLLRTLIDTIPDYIYIKDTNHRIVLSNLASARSSGVTLDEIIGKDNFAFFPAEMAEQFHADEDQLFQSGLPLIDHEEHTLGPDGQLIWVSTTKVPLRNLNGELIGLVGITRDISERKQAEAALQQAFHKEKELGELKSRFFAMASHEFRTPLTSILLMTETLGAYRHKLADAQIKERLDQIQAQANYLKAIMEDVLQLTELEAPRTALNLVRLDLDALCRSILDEFQSQPDSIHRLLYIGDETVGEVYLDKKLMRHLMTNLVSNALKYSPADKPILVRLSHATDTAVIQVQDQGIGIPEADLKYLFEPFHRAANVGKIAGTGLGLTIVKAAVERQGGTIAVESQDGVGTTFTVRLPRVNSD